MCHATPVAEMVNPFCLWVCGHQISLTDMEREEIGFPGWEERVKLCVENPLECANFFEIVVESFHEVFLGFDKANGGVQMLDEQGRPKGFFGPAYAHANSVEQNTRDMHHLHGGFFSHILQLQDLEDIMRDAHRRVLAWMSSLATACLPYVLQKLGGDAGSLPDSADIDPYRILEDSMEHDIGGGIDNLYSAGPSEHDFEQAGAGVSEKEGIHIAGLSEMPSECCDTYKEDVGLRVLDDRCDNKSLLYELFDKLETEVNAYEQAPDKSEGSTADKRLRSKMREIHTWVACQRSTVFHKHTARCRKRGCKGDDTDCNSGFGPIPSRVLRATWDERQKAFGTPRNMPKMVWRDV